MAVSASLVLDNPAPGHGEVVTATYVVTGNDATPAQDTEADGNADVGGIDYPVSAPLTLPGSPALPQTFDTPACLGLVFVPTADPAVFTAVVP